MKSLRSSTAIRKPARTLVGSPQWRRFSRQPWQDRPALGVAGRSPCRSRQPRRLPCLVSLGSCYSLRWRSAWAHPPPAPSRRRSWITISRRCGRRCFRHRAPRTPSAPAVPHLRASTSAARLRRLAPAGVESCTVKPGTKIFVAASSVECSTFEEIGAADAELRDVCRDATAGRQVCDPPSPSTASPCR